MVHVWLLPEGFIVLFVSVSPGNATITAFSRASRSDDISFLCSTLAVSPASVIIPGITVASRGDDVNLLCSSKGGPGNHYQWLMEGANLPEENSTMLVRHQVSSSHGGDYTCLVSNAAGTSSATITLYIEPYVTLYPVRELVVERTSAAQFSCMADGFPLPSVTWWKTEGYGVMPGINISVSDSVNLIFPSVSHESNGTYICVATAEIPGMVDLRMATTLPSVLIGTYYIIIT